MGLSKPKNRRTHAQLGACPDLWGIFGKFENWMFGFFSRKPGFRKSETRKLAPRHPENRLHTPRSRGIRRARSGASRHANTSVQGRHPVFGGSRLCVFSVFACVGLLSILFLWFFLAVCVFLVFLFLFVGGLPFFANFLSHSDRTSSMTPLTRLRSRRKSPRSTLVESPPQRGTARARPRAHM